MVDSETAFYKSGTYKYDKIDLAWNFYHLGINEYERFS